MSSSLAMNRRISRNGGGDSVESNNVNNLMNNTPKSLSGTAIQQHYQILNFHEKRLQQVFEQVHLLTSQLNKLEPDVNLRLHRLEQENASLRRHISNLQNGNENNDSVSLQISEN